MRPRRDQKIRLRPGHPTNAHCDHEPGTDDFHVVPFLKPGVGDDVEVVPTVHAELRRSKSAHCVHGLSPSQNAVESAPSPWGEGWGDGDSDLRQPQAPPRRDTRTRLPAFHARRRLNAFAMLLFGIFAHNSIAATITVNPVADADIRQFDPNTPHGDEPSVVSGQLGQNDGFEIRRALMRFDVGQVPAGAVINSVTLRVTVVRDPLSAVNSIFEVRRVLQSWTETGVCWNSRTSPGTPWQVPGATGAGDSAGNASSAVLVSSTDFTDYTFSSTAALVADVQAWVNDPSVNFGWLLISEDEVSHFTARRFGSREDPGHAPVLTVNYTLASIGVTIQPPSQTVPAGGSATFTANATGTPPFTYQWFFNGNPITGATSDTLVLTNLQTSQSGPYTVTVNNQSGTATSAPATLTVTPPQGGPVVTITAPTNGAVFPAHSDVLLSADARETNGVIAQVEFLLGTNSVGIVTNTPYDLILSNLAAGRYLLTARATDTQGNVGVSAPVSFSTGVPLVAITSPTNGAKFPENATILFAADASEPGAVITQVEFFLDTNSIGVATSSPFSIVRGNVPAGSHVVTAQATDNQGNVVSSQPVNFSVIAPPGVILSAPAAGARFPIGTNVTVTAIVATKGASIVRVDFFASLDGLDATNIGSMATSPYTLNWLPAGPGDFTLSATVLDELGQTGQSTGVVVRVFIPEIILPTVAITDGPRNFARVTESPITLSGTASDNIGVDHVEFSVVSGPFLQNPGPFVPAEGTENWTAQVPLQPGKNAVRARSVDLANNKSAIVTRFYTYIAQAPLTIVLNGDGTVVPNLDGRDLELGKTYTVAARPAVDQIFARWEIRTNADLSLTNGVVFTSRATLSFQMRSNLVLVADFEPNPFAAISDAYIGLFFDANTNRFRPENSGLFALQLDKGGGFSGHIVIQGAAHPFHGGFDFLGKAQVPIVRRVLPPVVLALQLDIINGSGTITGAVTTVSDANTLTSGLLANRTARPPPVTGRQDFSLNDDAGDGIVAAASFTSSSGTVVVRGSLQSFGNFNFATTMSSDGSVPFYLPFDHGAGVIMGWLQFGTDGGQSVSGQLFWVAPAFPGVSLLDAVGQ